MSLAAVPAYLLARRMAGQWLVAARGDARGRDPVARLHGHADDRERVLPALPDRASGRSSATSSGRAAGASSACSRPPSSRSRPGRRRSRSSRRSSSRRCCSRCSTAAGCAALRDHAGCTGSSAALVVLVTVAEEARGHSPLAGARRLRVGRPAAPRDLDVARWFLYHLAEIDLYVGVIPFAALIALAAMAYRLPRQYRAFVAAVVPTCVFLLGVVAEFASRPDVARIEERNTFYLAPLFLIALVAGSTSACRARCSATGIAAVAAAALPGVIPFSSLINVARGLGHALADPVVVAPGQVDLDADRLDGRRRSARSPPGCSSSSSRAASRSCCRRSCSRTSRSSSTRSRPARTASARPRSARCSSATRTRTATGSTAPSATTRTCRALVGRRPRRSRSGRTSSSTAASGRSTT